MSRTYKDSLSNKVLERGRTLREQRIRQNKRLEDSGDYSSRRLNDYDQLNRELEHFNDTDAVRSIFEK